MWILYIILTSFINGLTDDVFTLKCNLICYYLFRGFPLIKTRDVYNQLQVCSYHTYIGDWSRKGGRSFSLLFKQDRTLEETFPFLKWIYLKLQVTVPVPLCGCVATARTGSPVGLSVNQEAVSVVHKSAVTQWNGGDCHCWPHMWSCRVQEFPSVFEKCCLGAI